MAEEKAEFDLKSEQVKEQLKHEFQHLFTDPQSLPPLRHQNHRIELEEGATLPKLRGLPRLSHKEIEETVCVCLLLQDLVQSCLRGEGGDIGGHVLRETTSRGLCGLVCSSRTSERGGEGASDYW
jgi:hypothetical protein